MKRLTVWVMALVVMSGSWSVANESGEAATQDRLISLEEEISAAVVKELEGLHEIRMELLEMEEEYAESGKKNLLKKIEKMDEKIRDTQGDLNKAVENQLKGYKRDVEKLTKKKSRLDDNRVRAKDDKTRDRLDRQSLELELEIRPMLRVIDAFEQLRSDTRMMFSKSPRGDSLMAQSRFAAPDFVIAPVEAEGEAKGGKLSEIRGDMGALVVFWSVRNKESVKAFQELLNDSSMYARQGIKVVAVNVADEDSKAVEKEAPKKAGDAFIGKIDLHTAKDLDVRLVPQVALITKDGKVHSVFVGDSSRTGRYLKKILKDLEDKEKDAEKE